MSRNFPRSLNFQGRQILLSGKGRATGSMAYLDATQGETLELFQATVVQTGNRFSLASVEDNVALPSVRIDHSLLPAAAVGQRLIVGPLDHSASGPQARGVWARGHHHGAVQNALRKPKVRKPRRLTGVIGHIAPVGTYGRIIDAAGHLVFMHRSELKSGHMRIGQRVTFRVRDEGRGPKAVDIHAA